jgi:hypothetical protein
VRLALVLTIATGFAFGLVAGATALVGRGPPPAPRPTGVVWADRVFTTRRDLGAWLEARGSNYSVWAVRHPALASTFEVRFGEPMAVGLAGAAPPAADSIVGDNSKLLVIIGGVILAMVAVVTASRAVRRFASHGQIRFGRRLRRVRVRDSDARSHSTTAEWASAISRLRRAGAEARYGVAHALSRARMRRWLFPGIGWYATSCVLAFAVGAWIAIYLK